MCEDLRLASTGKLTPNWEGHQGREGHRGTGAVMQRCRDAGEAGEAGRTSGIGVDPPVSVKSVANLRSILLTERVAPNRRVPHPSDGPSYTPPSTGGPKSRKSGILAKIWEFSAKKIAKIGYFDHPNLRTGVVFVMWFMTVK